MGRFFYAIKWLTSVQTILTYNKPPFTTNFLLNLNLITSLPSQILPNQLYLMAKALSNLKGLFILYRTIKLVLLLRFCLFHHLAHFLLEFVFLFRFLLILLYLGMNFIIIKYKILNDQHNTNSNQVRNEVVQTQSTCIVVKEKQHHKWH